MIGRTVLARQRGTTEEVTEGFSGTESATRAPLLLEREGELAELGAALSRARRGSGRVVLIEGPAGIGKTRLLNETRDRARQLGLDVLAARGGELERGYGFGVVRQLLEAALARASPDERSGLLSGAAVLAEPVFLASASASPSSTDTTQSVLHGLYWLVANLAERSPLLLTIDDVQWADEPSLRFLLYLARRLDGVPVVLGVAMRTGDVSADAELLRAVRLEAHPPVLEPTALSAQATRTLAETGLGRVVSEDLGRACHAATRGNPFLLTELLHQLRGAAGDTDPAAVDRMASEQIAAAILLRIGRLGSSAAALVRATSVLGESADLETAAALASLERTAAAGLVDVLARAEILESSAPSRPLRFVHPLVRTAVYEDMPRSDRARLHGRAARLLAASRGGTEAAAIHLLLSDPAGREANVELLREAARAAMARGAPETATEFLRRAERESAPETARAALLLELGVATSRAGQADGVDLLREAFRSASGQPARALAGLELGFALGVSSSQSTEAIEVLERAREGLQNERLRTLVDARLVMFAVCVPTSRPRLSAHLREARTAIDRPASDDLLELLAPLAGDLLFVGGSASDVARLAERALGGDELMRRDVETEGDLALLAVTSLIYAGRLRMAKHHVDDGVAQARTRGSPFALARLSAFRALVSWRLGELSTADADAQTALSVDAAWGIPHAISSAVLAQVRIERDDLAGARVALDSLDADPALLEVTPNQIIREARAGLLIAEGEPGEALTQLRAYALWEQQSGLESRGAPVAWRSAAALAHLQLGELEEARELAARELEIARQFAAGPRLGAALRALAIVEGGSDGLALLEEAVSVLDASGARLDQARAVVDLGALLRRCGQRRAAIDTLRAGRELAHRCTSTALVEFAATQLRLAGARPRRIALSGRDSLTPSERRVTELATQGMSNKQLAQALFVTLRTVEMHLSNAYRKLGISSREELPAALGTS
jgi:DNA-binding CsgD family transcriptional regulator